MQYDDVTTNPIWRTDTILKVVFLLWVGGITSTKLNCCNMTHEPQFYAGYFTLKDTCLNI